MKVRLHGRTSSARLPAPRAPSKTASTRYAYGEPWLNRLVVFLGSPTSSRASMLALPSGWIVPLGYRFSMMRITAV